METDLTKIFYIAEVNGNTSFQDQVITSVIIEIIFLFYVKEDESGKKMFSQAAQTRKRNIINSNWYNSAIHKIHKPPIESFDQIEDIIKMYIEKYGGEEKVAVKEIGIFSHSGLDGPATRFHPVSDPLDDNPYQKTLQGWGKINFYWKKQGARLVFYGCQSAHEERNFARNISKLANCANVEVVGQTTYAYPSFYPDYRVTGILRSRNTRWNSSPTSRTYMVGSEENMGIEATGLKQEIMNVFSLIGFESIPEQVPNFCGSDEFILSDDMENLNDRKLKNFPIAMPMKFYKNGICINTSHQGIFNDHRKKNLE